MARSGWPGERFGVALVFSPGGLGRNSAAGGADFAMQWPNLLNLRVHLDLMM